MNADGLVCRTKLSVDQAAAPAAPPAQRTSGHVSYRAIQKSGLRPHSQYGCRFSTPDRSPVAHQCLTSPTGENEWLSNSCHSLTFFAISLLNRSEGEPPLMLPRPLMHSPMKRTGTMTTIQPIPKSNNLLTAQVRGMISKGLAGGIRSPAGYRSTAAQFRQTG